MGKFTTKYGTYPTIMLYANRHVPLTERLVQLSKKLDIPVTHIVFTALDVMLPILESELPKRLHFIVEIGVTDKPDEYEKVEVKIDSNRKKKGS